MAGKYDIGPRIGITGEAEFNNSIKQINKSFKALDAEMAAVASQFDKNDKSINSYSLKNDVLSKQMDNQRSKLKLLTDQQDKQRQVLTELERKVKSTSDEFGENSNQASKARIEYNKQVGVLADLSTNLSATTANLNKMEKEYSDNEKGNKGI